MAKFGDVKLDVVYSEERNSNVKVTDHPVESGFNIADHVSKDPTTIDISGVCVGTDSAARLNKLLTYQKQGKRLTYVGRYALKDSVIQSIKTTKDVDVAGHAYKFDISIKQIMVVKTSTYKKSSGGTKQPVPKNPTKRTYYVVKGGDVLSEIALKFYGHGTEPYWRKIYNANIKIIGPNPHIIKAGQTLLIP